jgi:hypothetical protein
LLQGTTAVAAALPGNKMQGPAFTFQVLVAGLRIRKPVNACACRVGKDPEWFMLY